MRAVELSLSMEATHKNAHMLKGSELTVDKVEKKPRPMRPSHFQKCKAHPNEGKPCYSLWSNRAFTA